MTVGGSLLMETALRPSVRSRTVIPMIVWIVGACGGARGSSNSDVKLASAARELTADEQAVQAVSRLTFGPRPGEIAAVHAMGVDRWIDAQLHPDRIPDSTWSQYSTIYESQRTPAQALAETYPPQDLWLRQLKRSRGLPDTARYVMTADDSAQWKVINTRTGRLTSEIVSARVARAQISDRELLEVMTDFWENHFSVFSGKMPTRFTLLEYDRDVIRANALGRFRDLLGAVAHSPAMLFYLDNYVSGADAAHRTVPEVAAEERALAAHQPPPPRRRRSGTPNENYGRELLELHTLGVDGGYTQHDVMDAARALTGWTIKDPRLGGGFVFRPEVHDADTKVVLGHTLMAGRGVVDGEDLLDIVANHPSTARHIALKLAQRFVSDVPPPGLVRRAADTFQRTHGDIRAVVAAIVHSPEFFSRSAYRAKVKSPFEYVVSLRRALNAAPDSTSSTGGQIGRLGQPVFGHQTPEGYPETGETWLNTGSLLQRINFAVTASQDRYPGVTLARWSPSWTLSYQPATAQVDGVIATLLDGSVSAETRRALLADAPASGASAAAALPALVGVALGAPEFQRR
jgi:uncharacterized protein (DUF1800 family)